MRSFRVFTRRTRTGSITGFFLPLCAGEFSDSLDAHIKRMQDADPNLTVVIFRIDGTRERCFSRNEQKRAGNGG